MRDMHALYCVVLADTGDPMNVLVSLEDSAQPQPPLQSNQDPPLRF